VSERPKNLRLERVGKTVDMMVTMHSKLRDELAAKALRLDLIRLLLSVAVGATVFADPDVFGPVGWGETGGRWLVGGLACLTFFLSLATWRADWRGRANAHRSAARAYAVLKLQIADLFGRDADPDSGEVQRLLERYRGIGEQHAAIPEREFARLKGHHLSKVLLSRLLDRHPGASVRVLKLRTSIKHTMRALRSLES